MIKIIRCPSILLSLFVFSISVGIQADEGALDNQSIQRQQVQEQTLKVQQQLLVERQKISGYLNEAYALYPEVPKGVLEALAFVGSRWHHQLPNGLRGENLQPKNLWAGHLERPQPVGIMGLYTGQKRFRNTLDEAAKVSGYGITDIINNPRIHVLATAALVSERMDQFQVRALEDMVPVFASLSGLPNSDSKVANFAVNTHVYDVFLSLATGYDDQGIMVPEVNFSWSQVFSTEQLQRLRSPFINIDVDADRVDYFGGESVPDDIKDQSQSVVKENNVYKLSTDYGPALWVTSPYYGNRTKSIDSVTIHTTQGSYAGTISWFQNNPYSVSAHYVIRSSDGQITQMVRESKRAHHVGIHNSATLGIEHEGFVSNPAYYTTAMYNASANLTKHFCQTHNINCATGYSGPSSSTVQVLSTSIKVKGHQHYSSQTHTDPGIHWDWSRYYGLINGGSSHPNDQVFDTFETSEGHFTHSPSYSGSTTGISSASTAERNSSVKRYGSWSEQIKLVDNPNSSANWSV